MCAQPMYAMIITWVVHTHDFYLLDRLSQTSEVSDKLSKTGEYKT